MNSLLVAEQDMFKVENPELSKNAARILGVEVIRLLQEADSPEVGYEQLWKLMIEERVSLSEDIVHLTLRGLHDYGYIKINLFDASVGMTRNEENLIINRYTGEQIY